MKIYADTSVFGGVFDPEFAAPSQRFFEEIEAGHFTVVTSVMVETEVEPAPKPLQGWFRKFINYAQIAPVNESALQLQQKYLDTDLVTAKSTVDALHVAITSVSRCDLIVSWNFKHMIHFDKIPKYHAVNVLNDHGQIGIYSPLEVIQYYEENAYT